MADVEWLNLKAHDLRRLARADAIAVVPVGSVEQHGPHLPVQTDTRLAHETSCRAARRVIAGGGQAVVLPTVWLGLSDHHVDFGGTLTADYETFHAVLAAVVRSVTALGFRRVLFNNGHGGNIDALKVSTQRLARETAAVVVATTYPMEAVEEFGEILEDQDFIQHADEAETSMMLALVPDLVDAGDLASCEGAAISGPLSSAKGYRWRPFSAMTANGVRGNPTRASAEKGERLLDAAAAGLARLMLAAETWAPIEDRRLAETGGVPLRD
ncbi:MAG: creatininase family protein [Hyphomicrobiales bacterium]|nr:creatininase family protein [Hyphomicrobiales bacterium]